MKRLLLIYLFLCASLFTVFSQDTTINLNLLQTPVSPAGSLLGISPSQIDKPTDPEAFMASVKNASVDFTKVPSSYAVDFAPAWLFFGNKISYNSFRSTKLCPTIWQSLVISTAVKNTSDSGLNKTQFSVGLKISLIRGKVDGSKVDSLIELSTKLLKKLNTFLYNLDTLIKKDKEYNFYKAKMGELARAGLQGTKEYGAVKELAESRLKYLTALVQNASIAKLTKAEGFNVMDSLKSIAEKIKWKRMGFKLDLCGGAIFDFPNMDFRRGSITKVGIWLTGGYELKNLTFLAIIRYLYNPNQIIGVADSLVPKTQFHTLDGGVRLVYNSVNNKFLFSGEALYRSVFESNIIAPGWRFTINAEYEVMRNIKLNLSLGKDFDGSFTKGGNLITSLNLILGFGSNKKL
jgi:hypothetical protein